MRKTVLSAIAAAVATFVAVCSAWPQSSSVVKIVIPFAPGGGVDVVARMVADEIGKMHGPTVIVENRPGGGTVTGTQDVLRAAPDGNTLLFINNSIIVAPQLKTLDYDPLSSLAAICNVATTPTVFVVSSASPYKTLGDLINAARARPGAMNYGAVSGSVLHIGFALLEHAADIRMTLIPYGGTIPVVAALLGGQVDAALMDYPTAAGQLQAGKLRALALGSAKRVDWLPDVPTAAEAGIKDYDVQLFYGLFAPAKTPPDTVSQLARWFTEGIRAPELQARLAAQGVSAVGQCGAEFSAFLRGAYDTYGRVIREANIKAE